MHFIKSSRKKYLVFTVIFLISLLSYSQTQISGSSPISIANPELKAYIDHDPIQILSDEDFIDYGFEGEGSYSDPFIIENLRIINSTHKGIEINDTSVFFIIRDCYIETDQKGILVKFAADWTVRIYNNVLMDNNFDGIIVADTNYYSIIGNTGIGDHTAIRISRASNGYIANNEHIGGENIEFVRSVGIHLSESEDTIIYNNYFESFNRGIFTHSCSNLTIQQNSFVKSKEYAGIYLYYSNLNRVLNNTCLSNVEAGILFYGSNLNLVKYNNITGNGLMGLTSIHSSGNLIYYNNFITNGFNGSFTSQGWEEQGGNSWCNLETQIGNYWSDYNSSIGIYEIAPGTNFDPYPLNSPYIPENIDIDIIIEPTNLITEETDFLFFAICLVTLSLVTVYNLIKKKKK